MAALTIPCIVCGEPVVMSTKPPVTTHTGAVTVILDVDALTAHIKTAHATPHEAH